MLSIRRRKARPHAIALRLADETTPAYGPVYGPVYAAPDYRPLAYAGVGVDTAPPRTALRVGWDAMLGTLKAIGLMILWTPRLLKLVALALIGVAYLLIGLGRVVYWLATTGPRVSASVGRTVARPVVAYQRSRIPFAELAEVA